MEKEILSPSPLFVFSSLNRWELNSIELTDGFHSPYNIKAVFNSEIVGYIIVEETNPHFQANEPLDDSLLNHLNLLNSKRWFLIRKMYFKEQFRDTGNLENMFDKLVSVLPDDCDLWCNVSMDSHKYIEQIGGFTSVPKSFCANTSVRIFNVYQRKHE